MSFRENASSNDNVAIKVKRHDSKSRFTNLFGKGNNNNPTKPRTIETSVLGDGFLTAQARKYNPDTNEYGDWFYLCKDKHNLLTNGGRDFFHVQCYGSSGLGTNGTNYVAVNATATTPAAGDTTLASELTTNGFARAQGTVAHTNGTNATTVTITFTATGTQNKCTNLCIIHSLKFWNHVT